MGSIEELTESVKLYQNQLDQIDQALAACPEDDVQRAELESLKADLLEILTLTNETITIELGSVGQSESSSLDDEMKLFNAEIEALNGSESVTANDAEDESLKSLVGEKCSAPFTHSWGDTSYHNAFICGLESKQIEESDKTRRVRVMFMNPTHKKMLPCSFFLEGSCKFDEKQCHFSHGESVEVESLKDYVDPDYSLLTLSKCHVLAKQSDSLWHKGKILSCDIDNKKCRIQFEQPRTELDCPFENIFPIEDLENSDVDSNSNSDSSDSEEQEASFNSSVDVQNALLVGNNERLGDWERHTKGIGSKLMMKMGYIIGNGLGSNCDGIVNPVSAQVLPQGKSLDHCMELREQAKGDENLFSVEKRLKRQQKRQVMRNKKAYENAKSREANVFKFINSKVFSNASEEPVEHPKSKYDLKQHSDKHLNVANFKLGEDIRKLEKEISKTKATLGRHSRSSEVYKIQNERLLKQQLELNQLRATEKSVDKEQQFRKDNSKLRIF